MVKKIYLGADHAGFKLKEKVKKWLEKQKIPFQDLGNLKYDPEDDFPDFAKKVAQAVVKKRGLGILVCGTSQGMCITANKVKGIVAAPAWNIKTARHAKTHDNANIICLGSDFVSGRQAKKMIKIWLKSKFSSAKKYTRRLNKIKKI